MKNIIIYLILHLKAFVFFNLKLVTSNKFFGEFKYIVILEQFGISTQEFQNILLLITVQTIKPNQKWTKRED